jgi:hypothetical protein
MTRLPGPMSSQDRGRPRATGRLSLLSSVLDPICDVSAHGKLLCLKAKVGGNELSVYQ